MNLSLGSGSKKGNVFAESLTVVIIILVFIVMIFMSHMIQNDMNDEIQADDDFTNETKELMQENTSRFPQYMDPLVVFLGVMLWITVIIAALLIDTHPAFAVITFVLMIITLIVSAMLANNFYEVLSEPELVGLQSDFPISMWVIENIVQMILVMSITTGIILYGKLKS